jgi:hypothetical protein
MQLDSFSNVWAFELRLIFMWFFFRMTTHSITQFWFETKRVGDGSGNGSDEWVPDKRHFMVPDAIGRGIAWLVGYKQSEGAWALDLNLMGPRNKIKLLSQSTTGETALRDVGYLGGTDAIWPSDLSLPIPSVPPHSVGESHFCCVSVAQLERWYSLMIRPRKPKKSALTALTPTPTPPTPVDWRTGDYNPQLSFAALRGEACNPVSYMQHLTHKYMESNSRFESDAHLCMTAAWPTTPSALFHIVLDYMLESTPVRCLIRIVI